MLCHIRDYKLLYLLSTFQFATFQLFYYLHCRLVIQLAPLSHDVTVDRFSPMATK